MMLTVLTKLKSVGLVFLKKAKIRSPPVRTEGEVNPSVRQAKEILMPSPILTTYFGMTIEALNYNWGYYGGPVEAWPTIPFSVARSWDVWSPGNGQIEYLDWSDLNPSAGVYNWTALNAWISANQANNSQMVYTFGNPPAWAGSTTTNL